MIPPIGTPETPVAWGDLRNPEKHEPVPSHDSETPKQGYAQEPCVGAIGNDGVDEEMGRRTGTG